MYNVSGFVYFDTVTYGYDYTMSGTDYLRLRENKSEQEQRQIYIYEDIEYHIYPKYEDDRYTAEIEEMNEIFAP